MQWTVLLCWVGKIKAPPSDSCGIDAGTLKAGAAATSCLVDIGQGGQSDKTEIC